MVTSPEKCCSCDCKEHRCHRHCLQACHPLRDEKCCEKCNNRPNKPGVWTTNQVDCLNADCPCHHPTLQRGPRICADCGHKIEPRVSNYPKGTTGKPCFTCGLTPPLQREGENFSRDHWAANPQQADEWEKEWESRKLWQDGSPAIKSFIRSLIKQEKEKARKEGYEEGYGLGLTSNPNFVKNTVALSVKDARLEERKAIVEMCEKEAVSCAKCEGQGWYADHADEHAPDGSCINCPVQVQCEQCQATGKFVALDRILEIINQKK